MPLVVVGSAPYADEYTAPGARRSPTTGSGSSAGSGTRTQLDQLYANCCTYLHGHSVGGTNPSLLRAIGAGAAVARLRRRLQPRGARRRRAATSPAPADVAALVEAAEADPAGVAARRAARARELAKRYDWDDVAAGYEQLAAPAGRARRPGRRPSGRRTRPSRDRRP